MAIVIDAARQNISKLAHATTYQKGNAAPNTPTPTWSQTENFLTASSVESHITTDGVPVDNTADAWLPLSDQLWLPSVPATVRF